MDKQTARSSILFNRSTLTCPFQRFFCSCLGNFRLKYEIQFKAVFVRANNVYLVLPIISPFLCVKLISLIRINFVHLNQNSRFFCIKTRFLLLKFSRFKHNSSDSKLLNGTKMKTSMINFNLTFKAWLFSDYLGKVVQMD